MSQQQRNVVFRTIPAAKNERAKNGTPPNPVKSATQLLSSKRRFLTEPTFSAVNSGPTGQPPLKTQKIAPVPSAVANINSAGVVVALPMPTTYIAVSTELSHLSEGNRQLTSRLSETEQQQLAQSQAELQQLVNVAGCVCRWPIGDDFCGSLKGKFIEGTFSLTFPQLGRIASLRWKGTSRPTEVNLVVNVKIEGQSGEISDRSFRVNNLKNNDVAVDLVYAERIDQWTSWTLVEVEFPDFTPIRLSGEAARSYWIIRNAIDFQRLSSISATTHVEANEVQSGKQSDPVHPVVKTERIESSEVQVGIKSSLSAIDAGSIEQPQAKRQKIAPSPANLVNMGVNSAAAAVAVPLPTAQLFLGSDLESDGNNDQLIQAVTTELSQSSQLREENRRLTSTLSETQQQMANNEAEAYRKLTEKTAELTQLQLSCDQFKLMSKSKAKQLQKERESAKSHQCETAKLREKNANLEGRLLRESSAWKEKNIQLDVDLKKLTSELSNQRLENDQHVEEINRQSIVIDEKTKLEENLRAQLALTKKFFEEETVRLLSVETLPLAIRLANKFSSDLLMSECFRFVKREKGSEKMWEDLHLHLQLPKILAQIIVFSGSGESDELPKFHYSSGINPT